MIRRNPRVIHSTPTYARSWIPCLLAATSSEHARDDGPELEVRNDRDANREKHVNRVIPQRTRVPGLPEGRAQARLTETDAFFDETVADMANAAGSVRGSLCDRRLSCESRAAWQDVLYCVRLARDFSACLPRPWLRLLHQVA